jgi:23S rRNA maturation-related 3'-5' exoribonuclease YhaM
VPAGDEEGREIGMLETSEIQADKDKIVSVLRETSRDEICGLIDYLEDSDFFIAPASTKYHGAYPGGLAEHSLHVWHLLQHKNEYYRLGLPDDTVAITALGHDNCKINFYGKGTKNVLKGKKKIMKNKKVDGKWVEAEEEINDWQEEEVIVVNDQFPLGHGEKSVITLLRFIQLTNLEIAMIRWHMGGYVPKDDYRDLSNAVDMYPAIVALHAADLEASHLLRIGGKQG